MSAKEIQSLRDELTTVKEELAQLKVTLDVFFDTLSPDEYTAWRRAKRGVSEMPGDVTVGKNLPQAPTRLVGNNIGGALPL